MMTKTLFVCLYYAGLKGLINVYLQCCDEEISWNVLQWLRFKNENHKETEVSLICVELQQLSKSSIDQRIIFLMN